MQRMWLATAGKELCGNDEVERMIREYSAMSTMHPHMHRQTLQVIANSFSSCVIVRFAPQNPCAPRPAFFHS